MPHIGGRSCLFTPAVDICHGVGAALDVGAAQEGPAIEANLLHPTQYEVGFSVKEDKITKIWLLYLNPLCFLSSLLFAKQLQITWDRWSKNYFRAKGIILKFRQQWTQAELLNNFKNVFHNEYILELYRKSRYYTLYISEEYISNV